MATFMERVTVMLEAVSGRFEKSMERAAVTTRKFSVQMKQFLRVVSLSQNQLRGVSRVIDKVGTSGQRAALSVRKFTTGLKGFRMEMLGVLFFGLALLSFFKNLLRPAFDLVGIFDIFRSTLELLFLPLALLILPFFVKFLDFVSSLSDRTKTLIGIWALLGLGLGGVLFLFGTFVLGIGSMIIAFSGLFNIIDKLIPDVNVMGVNMSSFIEVGLGITILTTLFKTFKGIVGSLFDKLLEFEFVKETFDELGVIIDENLNGWALFKDIVSQAWDKIKEKMGLDTEFGAVDGWLKKIEKKATKLWDGFLDDLEDLGLLDLIDAVGNVGAAFDNIAPSLRTIADLLSVISGLIDDFERGRQRIVGAAQSLGRVFDLPFTNNQANPISNVNLRSSARSTRERIQIVINQNNNLNAGDIIKMERLIEDNNRNLVDDIRRLVKT